MQPKKNRLDQNDRLAAIIYFHMLDIWETVLADD